MDEEFTWLSIGSTRETVADEGKRRTWWRQTFETRGMGQRVYLLIPGRASPVPWVHGQWRHNYLVIHPWCSSRKARSSEAHLEKLDDRSNRTGQPL